MMVVYRADNLDQLLPYRERWDQLAGECPFRRWTWLSTWWKHYQREGKANSHLFAPRRTLCVLLVVDTPSPCPETSNDPSRECTSWNPRDPRLANIKPETILAVAPWYLEHSVSRGNVLRLLGDGEVCSDHLSLLLEQEHQEKSISALARSLCKLSGHWDLLQCTGIETGNPGMQGLLDALEQRGCHLQRSQAPSRWSLDLPDCWDDFLYVLSKSHRKQLRRLLRQSVDTGRTAWYLASMPDATSPEAPLTKKISTIRRGNSCLFDTAWEHLVDLHQRRRQSLGEPGCFASPAYSKFHREVASLLLEEGRLRLSWLELEGRPVAAEYSLNQSDITYAYQGGLDPEKTDQSPGQLSLAYTIQHAIHSGHSQFDFLRGDEPYKAHWRATPYETWDVQVVPPRTGARWRYNGWTRCRKAGLWVRSLVQSKG